MFKITAIFLICLVAPFAYSQHDYLQMLKKSTEGKEVLNTLLIQSHLMQEDLNVSQVKSVLHTARQKMEEEAVANKAADETYSQECEADKVTLGSIVSENREKELALKRHLDAANRDGKRKEVFLQRATEEHDNYSKFASFIKQNKDEWNSFYTSAKENHEKIMGFLRTIGDSLRQAHEAVATANAQQQSFIELPESYSTSLAEVKSQFDNNNDNLSGLRPIISNLLEIMQDDDAVQKEQVRGALKRLHSALEEKIKERLDEFDEQNEVQVQLFESLEKAFHDNESRSAKVLEILTKAAETLEKKREKVTQAVKDANEITEKAGKILGLRLKECSGWQTYNAFASIRSEKIMSIVQSLEGVIADKWPVVNAFLQMK